MECKYSKRVHCDDRIPCNQCTTAMAVEDDRQMRQNNKGSTEEGVKDGRANSNKAVPERILTTT